MAGTGLGWTGSGAGGELGLTGTGLAWARAGLALTGAGLGHTSEESFLSLHMSFMLIWE